MRVAIISDTHFGYSANTELRDDPFIQGGEAVDLALKENADIILFVGDVFDSRAPSPDVLGRAMQIFMKPRLAESPGVELDSVIDKSQGEISDFALQGTPVVAIHGTHERRGRGLTTPVQLLERAGLLIHLHLGAVVFRKGNEKIAIHGMSGVPERYAKIILDKWSPKPVEGAINILMFHQSVSPFIYSQKDAPTLDLHDLPEGFDLTVDGHIHWNELKDLENGKFLIPGSTVATQLRKIESEKPKGFYIFDTEKNTFDFKKLSTPRKFYYKKVEFSRVEPQELYKLVKAELQKIEKDAKKPLVKLKLEGTIKEGFSRDDVSFSKIEQECGKSFVLRLDYTKILSKELAVQKELLESLKKKQLSVNEFGLEILKKHLKELKYKQIDSSDILLEGLAEGDIELVYNQLREHKHGRT
jgi:DNA repair exonuclease SbcCD nuclease subunit